jgi:ribosomal protection tetracycline resistance protein
VQTLNLGILAHVDAGKTSLTERLLHAAGVIDELGSVDAGSTQTDSLALERRRGITIKAAVVAFAVGDLTVNLIDTPGHPDFIAEVERVLGVLDGAVLVVSAVEGVQPQTRVLMRALRRLGIPALIFVNKLDRAGALAGPVLERLRDLVPGAVPMVAVRAPGTRDAAVRAYGPDDAAFTAGLQEVLADHDDAVLAAALDGGEPACHARLRAALARASRRGLVHPVFAGSAITGAGVGELMSALTELLPAAPGDADGPLSGTVFKVERGSAGERIALARLFRGTLRTRERVALPDGSEERVTGIRVYEAGGTVARGVAAAGHIARISGLGGVRIGDTLGLARPGRGPARFAPPTLETVVEPVDHADRGALHAALAQLAEQDPLIGLRQDPGTGGLALSLYGEVQKEVIEATLLEEHGLAVAFRETLTICIERPAGSGEAVEVIDEPPNELLATIGLRVDPAPPGTGVAFRLGVELGSMPLAFFTATEDSVRAALRAGGLRGWEVTDCSVTMTRSGYAARQSHSHQGFDKSMSSTGRDFRELAPRVLRTALERAGTTVLEPVHAVRLELPEDTLGDVVAALTRLGGVPHGFTPGAGAWSVLEGEVPAARVRELRRRLPSLTRGEGTLESAFARYAAVRGAPPSRSAAAAMAAAGGSSTTAISP